MDTQENYYSYFYQKLTNYLENNHFPAKLERIHSKAQLATLAYMKCITSGKEPAEGFDLVLDILYHEYTFNTDIIY